MEAADCRTSGYIGLNGGMDLYIQFMDIYGVYSYIPPIFYAK